MDLGLKSFVLCASFVSSGFVLAQTATCIADGEQPAQGTAIGCVTGAGVQVKTVNDNQAPVAGIVPLTPEQMPSNPPVVTYVNGKLSIVAKNSTLSDILRVVGEKTGALIDMPEGAEERVVSQLGPGPAREVIASLLNGSHFNYVMIGNQTDASSVAHVILTAKSDNKTAPAGAPSNGNAPTVAGFRPYVQPRTALQRAVMQPYQELQEQQRAQEVSPPSFQQASVTPEEPTAAEPEAVPPASGVPTASASNTGAPTGAPAGAIGSTSSPVTGTETAAVESGLPPNESGAPSRTNASGERTPQQMLQDMYETRRQMMQQQRQPSPQQ
jgi:hypothetical protein